MHSGSSRAFPSGIMHLTYCLNVHPGESFAGQWNAIRDFAIPLRERLGWSGPFGLGLRLGYQAAQEALHHPDFAVWCRGQGLYVFTINGFPYGNFHRAPVKAEVYRPDWSMPARCDYTIALAKLLAAWLPDGVGGSISTVPVGFSGDAVDVSRAASHLLEVAKFLSTLDKDICIGLEPEPGCVIETSDDVIRFFHDHRLLENPKARKHIGVCVDTCHCALAFERPADVLQKLNNEGIRIAKIQLSAALSITSSTGLELLKPFQEEVYLHQVSARRGNLVQKWIDLPEAMPALAGARDWDEARVHFHVPLDWAGDGAIHSTRDNMDDEFRQLLRAGICPHLEIETYTFGVLPKPLAGRELVTDLEAEMRWVLEKMSSS